MHLADGFSRKREAWLAFHEGAKCGEGGVNQRFICPPLFSIQDFCSKNALHRPAAVSLTSTLAFTLEQKATKKGGKVSFFLFFLLLCNE